MDDFPRRSRRRAAGRTASSRTFGPSSAVRDVVTVLAAAQHHDQFVGALHRRALGRPSTRNISPRSLRAALRCLSLPGSVAGASRQAPRRGPGRHCDALCRRRSSPCRRRADSARRRFAPSRSLDGLAAPNRATSAVVSPRPRRRRSDRAVLALVSLACFGIASGCQSTTDGSE